MKLITYISLILTVLSCASNSSNISNLLNGEEFEGEITYKVNLKNNTTSLSDKEVTKLLGSKQKFIFRNNQYLCESDGILKVKQFYFGKKHLHKVIEGTDTITKTDLTKLSEKIISQRELPSMKKINGIPCKIYEIETNNSQYVYYYNPNIKLNSFYYHFHELNFLNTFLEHSNALPLKFIKKNDSIEVERTFMTIERKKIDPFAFNLPLFQQQKLNSLYPER